jgi:hypothetical protein
MVSKPPPSTASPAGVPSGGNGKYIVLVLLLVVGVGGIVAYKMSKKDDQVSQIPSILMNIDAGPPPPTKHDLDIPPVEMTDTPDAGPKRPQQVGTYTPSNGCEAKTCSGRSTPDLDAALSMRARASKRCYNKALESDNTLTGKMTVSMRIGSNGAVCSANISNNDLGSAAVANCVANTFRSVGFPAPAGGCVEANVPMNFVQQK